LAEKAGAEKKVVETKVLDAKAIDLRVLIAIILVAALNIILSFALRSILITTALTIVTLIMAVFVRTLPKNLFKIIIYLLLGFSVYWGIGSLFMLADDPRILAVPDNAISYSAVALLALANSIPLIIALNDHPKRGMMFAGMGFVIIIYDVVFASAAQNRGSVIRPDVAVVIGILWSMIAILLTRSFGKIRSHQYGTPDKIKTAVTASFLTMPLYILLMFVYLAAAAIVGTPNIAKAENIPEAIFAISKMPMVDLTGFLGGIAWRYILFSIVVTSVVMLSYDLTLHALGVERQLLKSGEVRFIKKVVAEPVAAKKVKEEDPFEHLMTNLKKLAKEMDAKDRLDVAQLINRYKSEFEILTQKYSSGSKADVEKLLKEIEKAFETKYG
jgi:predicted CopG family antitoxin